MSRAALFVALVVLTAGCGSDDEGTPTATTAETVSPAEVESALQTALSQGASGVVHLETDRPKLVSCVKDAGSPSGWRCTVTPGKGPESYLCMVEIDPQTKQITKTTCARIDN